MDCPEGKIYNEYTKKCVNEDGRIGKAIKKGTYVSKRDKLFKKKKCEDDEVLNEITNKCVKKSGRIGKIIESGKFKIKKYDDCPPGKIEYEDEKGKKKCISVYGTKAQSLISKGELKLPKSKKGSKKESKKYPDQAGEEKFPLLKGLCGGNIKLKSHQKKVVKHMINNRGLLVIHDVGTGKTLTAIATADCLMKDSKEKGNGKLKVVIVTPKSLQKNFHKEMTKYGLKENDPRFYFFTLTEFYIHASTLEKEDLQKFMKNKLFIIDEVHNLKFRGAMEGKRSAAGDDDEDDAKKSSFSGMKSGKTKASKVTKIFIEAAGYAKKVLLLSATPVLNRPSEIINMIAMIDGEKPITYSNFSKNIYDWSGNKRMENFKEYFKCKISYYKPDRSEIDPEHIDYPKVKEKTVELKMTPELYKKYYKVQKLEMGSDDVEMNDEGPNYKQSLFFTALRRAVNNLEEDKNPKVEYVKKILNKANTFDPVKKTLIYSGYKPRNKTYLKYILDYMDENDIKYGLITGDESKNQRDSNVKKFNKGEFTVLIITKAGSEGLDLKGTENVIISEPYWNLEFINQVKGRAIRYKSHEELPEERRKVKVYNLLLVKEERFKKDSVPSVDTILYDFSREKDVKLKMFYEKLEKMSIENREC